jgi:hypothetical protein
MSSAAAALTCSAVLAQNGELLKGTIQTQEFFNPTSTNEQFGSPSLTRKDLPGSGRNTTIDPFDNSPNQQGETAVSVPQSATQTALVAPPAPYPPNSAENGLPGNFNQESPRSSRSPAGLQASVSENNDPDSSPELQLAWDAWHKRIAAAIFQRFDFFAHSAFKYSPPLMARIGYVVTSTGHIQNLNVVQHSSNPMFDLLITQCVKSLDGDSQLLKFPAGSRRMSVEKFGTFTQNYGLEGFKYTTGDRETIRQ